LDADDHGQPFTQREILLRTLKDVTSIQIRIPDMHVSSIAPVAEGFQIHITPSESLPHGLYVRHGTVTGTLRDGTILPPVPIEVSGHIRPVYAPEPPSYLFGVAHVGDPVAEMICWNTQSTAQFQITSVRSSSDRIVVTAIDQQRMKLQVLTDQPFTCKGNVTFNICRVGDGTPFTVDIPVLGAVIPSGAVTKVIARTSPAQRKSIP
jgi:hypothetical protein